MSFKWLDRTLFQGPFLALVFSDAEYRAALRRLKITDKDRWLPEGCQASVQTFQSGSDLTCVVSMDPKYLDSDDPLPGIGTLIHEATHVWQKVEDLHSLGDPRGRFGSESEAYAVENIAMQLIVEYQRRWVAARQKA
jgi:hypothetical protein